MKKTKKLLTKTGKLLLVISFVFSQLSSPLSVLAEEIGNNMNVGNQEENLSLDNNDDEIINEQDEEIEPINELDEDDNLDDNDNLGGDDQPEQDDLEGGQNPEETPNFTVEIVDEEDTKLYIIKNELEKTVTVKQLKEKNSEVTTIKDEEEVEITDETTPIKSGYQVTITKEPETPEEVVTPVTYTIILLGDYNADGMVNEEDKELLLELSKAELEEEFLNENMPLLDLNKDEIFNVLDVTYPIFVSGTWENDKVATDELENYLISSKEEVYVEDEEEIKVEYYVEGFNVDSLVGIEGKLIYDETLVELTKIEVNAIEQNIEELVNNKFIYLLDNYNEDGVLITLTFKALAVGEPVISIENIVASLGGVAANLDVEKVSTTFNILEYGKGGDEEITPPEPETPVVIPTKPTYVASTDNDLKVLTIEGYDIAFNPNTYEYTIKVKNDVTSLNISALLSSSKAIYYVEGNENFEVGENLVYVVVKAENGSTKTYTIRVEKEKAEVVVQKDNEEEKEDEEKNTEEGKNTSKTVIIILIILVIIGLIYVIFKDDEEDKQEIKKETPKEPVKIKEIKPTKETNTKKDTEKPVKKNNQNNNKKNHKKGSKK